MSLKIKLNQTVSGPAAEQLDGLAHLILLAPKGGAVADWPAFAYAERLAARLARHPQSDDEPLVFELPNAIGTRVVLGRIAEDASAFTCLSTGRELAEAALAERPERIDILAHGLAQPRMAEAVLAALLAGAHALPSWKSKPEPETPLKRIELWGFGEALDLGRVRATAAGNNLARDLTVRPPNLLTPGLYRKEIEALAAQHGWALEFLDEKALTRRGAGAFLAVAQGSDRRDAGIAHLRYRPAAASAAPVALIGKGICFDTGGTNLKPSSGMLGMHGDMQGSAVALGTLLALSEMQAPLAADCWLALAENQVGPRAYRQNEVVTASNGTSIEVIHTDAEGRMVLADTLALAARETPRLMIDYATLTGACISALGTRYSGAFTNRDAWRETLVQAGRDSGERLWPFPQDADYDEALDSAVADVKQCIIEGEADHILAGRFLARFVPAAIPWVHIDLAASEHKGGLAHVPSDVTGFGVRLSLSLLLDRPLPE